MLAPTEDEHDEDERFLRKHFLQEWKLVKSLLDDIVSNQQLSDLSSVHKTRFIVLLFFLFDSVFI
ncbi:hypothetical protein NC651_006379 [Populus alba x Populus x berolinensis]|nr:hypothetical protein NC651_006379 [Populus alba x Populus x berolinensis]